ncbi:MAG TPA: hypothetical protein PKA53_05820 [Sphingobacterium sp.]|nr:hypothetical protein [Sphingobacterium sp.]
MKAGVFVLFLLFWNCFRVLGQDPIRLGRVSNPELQEISGIIPSSIHEGLFWVHNDSGDRPQVYLIDSLCNLRHTLVLEGVSLIDAEDIAWFNFQGRPHILLADVGNNLCRRDTLHLYIFEEPSIDLLASQSIVPASAITTLKIKYPDRPRDTEAVFVDPVDHRVYCISKRDFRSQVFSFPLSLSDSTLQILTPEVTLPFNFVTATDISRDGKRILMKNLVNIYYWERKKGENICKTLQRAARIVPYKIEPQGEALCFDLHRDPFFYTISERPLGLDSYLYRYVID